jgi:hypothetical protein
LTKNPEINDESNSSDEQKDGQLVNARSASITMSSTSVNSNLNSNQQPIISPRSNKDSKDTNNQIPQLQQSIVQQSQVPTQVPNNPFISFQVECYDWVEYFTKDGSNQPYYHSTSLNKTVWEAPKDFLYLKGTF